MQKIFSNSSELAMILFASGILLILFVPIPPFLLDLLLIGNFSWALTILLLAFYTDKPLGFSTFPALLLISTLFRLSLNVSATRLILSDGDAGRVIASIGQYVIHDNYVMGLVIFLILIIVQYVVVTNGAQRVAEVAARFTLDSMPGKQMSIDADLNMGLISQKDAKWRRSQVEKEANFYGAMDGASKFVKGDAIAGILIILVDLIGGFAIGMAEKGLSLGESIHRYSLLTVGDGLLTQIPALTISMATGIIVTRAATDAQLGSEVARQVASYPKSLLVVCGSLIGLLFLKGIPVIPVLLVLALFMLAAFFARRSKLQKPQDLPESSLYEKIRVYPIEIQLNASLFEEIAPFKCSLLSQIQQLREQLAYEHGLVIPEVVLRPDPKLNYPYYALCLHGNSEEVNQLYVDRKLLVLSNKSITDKLSCKGIEVRDPHSGLQALWLSSDHQQAAIDAGLVLHCPLTVLIHHISDVVQNQLETLLTRNELETLLNQDTVSKLRDELIPNLLPFAQVQRILQNLLQEKVSIRLLPSILEGLLEYSKTTTDTNQLTELIRARLAASICKKLIVSQNCLPVLTLATTLEQKLNQCLHNNIFALPPNLTESFIVSLATQVERMLAERKKPVLLCSSLLRRQIKQLTERVIPDLTILGMNEIPIHIQIESFSVVN